MMYVWLGIVILLTFIEMATINLTSIWFIISGILALLVSLFIDNFFIQFLVFVVLGILLLITTRPVLEKFIQKRKQSTNLDRIIGMKGIVTESIIPLEVGEVKVDGKKWTAFSEKQIEKGKTVTILSIEGVKVKVQEIDE